MSEVKTLNQIALFGYFDSLNKGINTTEQDIQKDFLNNLSFLNEQIIEWQIRYL